MFHHMAKSYFFYFFNFFKKRLFIYLFMRHTHTHRGRDTGRGSSRLHAGSFYAKTLFTMRVINVVKTEKVPY